jgi:mannose-6-phosphate isomerase-like protein (cupin superfamily)
MTSSSQNPSDGPAPSLLPFRESFSEGEEYRLLLEGSPRTAGIRSGRVVLKPGEMAGEHTTGRHEEVLVILAGRGELWFKDLPSLAAEEGYLLYVPPQAIHDVRNTGTAELRYLYIVAPAREKGVIDNQQAPDRRSGRVLEDRETESF